MLMNRSDRFHELGDRTIASVSQLLVQNPEPKRVRGIILTHLETSSYGARLLEVAMHSLMQVLDDRDILPGKLARLSQMRSANKKHGNVGDIEIICDGDESYVIEAWDAKYGKPNVRDELEELSDKLEDHPETRTGGFVIDRQPEIDYEMERRIEDLQSDHSIDISILTFEEWVNRQLDRSPNEDETTMIQEWLLAYAESLARRRPHIAPIDEPTDRWLEDLLKLVSDQL